MPPTFATCPAGSSKCRSSFAAETASLISWGKVTKMVLKAAQELAETHDIDAEVVDLRTLRPLDEECILNSVRKTHRCIIVDEDWPYCGMGAGILEKIQHKIFDDLDAPIRRVCCDDVPVPFNHYLELAMQPSVEKVIKMVKEVCALENDER